MQELAKLVWVLILIIFFVGSEIFYILAIDIVVLLLIRLFKPKWFEKF